ncbi:glycosyltransferase family 2 protein [Streptomyces benahoarensis]|uniref:Glycosyltransferase family 2 protein n=1 Tax=Streptomyces benahoarensis TaxID=2595054 RepID=A0A553ZFT5_9ACTN|nr:glycosyltransferase family 2 protein [Streptomyces benahoarensis]TSB40266.1 glycosyltransferase family 2 protein [Streptomyces benahoarensis]
MPSTRNVDVVTVTEALEPSPGPTLTPAAQISIVVIAFNDVAHVAQAVRSALAQETAGAAVEVIAVDDASTDGTGAALDALAREHPRLRVLHRAENSGGCGTPRNDGLRAATGRFVMFLDSDDVLPPGAAPALLRAALAEDAPVASGACVRRELPARRDVPWQPALYRDRAVHTAPGASPQLVRDTLCVNKLYERAFLAEHAIVFPEGRFTYEDFVFTARVLAAAPRLVTIPDSVYIWHVRRAAARQSISLDRKAVTNWQARIDAHRDSVAILRDAGRTELARAARTKFLDHDLRMYVRELHTRDAAYRAEWWRLTRAYLDGFDEAEMLAARAPARWLARVVLAAPEPPADLDRLTQLAARPGRLLPPYARDGAGHPVWSPELEQVELDALDSKPTHRLPVTIDAEPVIGRRGVLRLRVYEMYGRLAAAGPVSVDVEWRRRADDRRGPVQTATLTPGPEETWTAEVALDLTALADLGPVADTGPVAWDLVAQVHCADGSGFRASLRASGPGLRRRVLLSRRHAVLLVQPYATTGGALALRVAAGVRSVWRIAAARLRR